MRTANCLPEMNKVVDNKLNEYGILLRWSLPRDEISLGVGYVKINSFRDENATDDEFKYILHTKKLDNIQLCKVEIFSNVFEVVINNIP